MPNPTASKWTFPSALVLASLTSATVVTALADDAPSGRLSASTLGEAAPPARHKVTAFSQPSAQHLYLIRTTLLALHDANNTGNYTVLRDTAGPQFQQRHSAADLAIAFQKVRGTLDLSPIAIRMPELSRPPVVTAEKQLQLAGIVPGDPTQVAFEMIFEPVGGHWRLSALAVGAAQQPAARPVSHAANSSRP